MQSPLSQVFVAILIVTTTAGSFGPYFSHTTQAFEVFEVGAHRQIVTFDSTLTDDAAQTSLIAKYGGTPIKGFDVINAMTVSLPDATSEAALAAAPGVVRVEVDAKIYPTQNPKNQAKKSEKTARKEFGDHSAADGVVIHPRIPDDSVRPQVASMVTLISFGDTWKFLDNGSNQGTAWRELSYDDNGWKSGPAQLGFGEGDESTLVNPAYITTYYRKTIHIQNADDFTSLWMYVQYDDAAAVYINGTHVYTVNMSVNPSYTQKAFTSVEEGYWDYISVPVNLLREGENVIAVEIHQYNLNSAEKDVSFQLEFYGVQDIQIPDPDPVPPPPYGLVAATTPDGITLTWSDSGINETGFVVARSTDNSAFTSIGTAAASTTTFTDTNLDESVNTYYYKVAAFNNVGTSSYSDAVAVATTKDQILWNIQNIGSPYAWSKGLTGAEVRVAIIDSGMDMKLDANNVPVYHPDLQENSLYGISVVDNDSSYDDELGHGTHIAGIIGAGRNSYGIYGAAPKAGLYTIKVFQADAQGNYFAFQSDLIEAVEWATRKNMQVINMSLGSRGELPALHDAIIAAHAKGIVTVAAAGNFAEQGILYPARYQEVIAVGAVDRDNTIASFSNTGPELDLVAPGVGIYSTYLNGTYQTFDGTSSAVPHVTGAVAQLMTRNPPPADDTNSNGRWDPAEIQNKLTRTATDLGPTGFDNTYGFGLINLQAAIEE